MTDKRTKEIADFNKRISQAIRLTHWKEEEAEMRYCPICRGYYNRFHWHFKKR